MLEQLKRKVGQLTELPKNGFVYYNGYFTDEEGVEHHYAHTLEPFRPLKSGVFLANYRFNTVCLPFLMSQVTSDIF